MSLISFLFSEFSAKSCVTFYNFSAIKLQGPRPSPITWSGKLNSEKKIQTKKTSSQETEDDLAHPKNFLFKQKKRVMQLTSLNFTA